MSGLHAVTTLFGMSSDNSKLNHISEILSFGNMKSETGPNEAITADVLTLVLLLGQKLLY
jgi:hypothetical protein